jgi:PadR family transcriptional regulator PadR
MGIRENLKRGTVEMLILFLLSKRDMYGYELSKELSEKSGGLYEIQEGSMYPTLYRLIEKKYISDYKELIGKRRTRVYYHVEDLGLQYLKEIVEEYDSLNQGIEKIFKSTY